MTKASREPSGSGVDFEVRPRNPSPGLSAPGWDQKQAAKPFFIQGLILAYDLLPGV